MIARLFQTTIANVYNSISRSKVKVREERFKLELSRYLEDRKKRCEIKSVLLPAPGHTTSYTSMAVSIYDALQYIGEQRYSLTEVMPYSGHAFRMNIAPDCSEQLGSTMIDLTNQ